MMGDSLSLTDFGKLLQVSDQYISRGPLLLGPLGDWRHPGLVKQAVPIVPQVELGVVPPRVPLVQTDQLAVDRV